MISYFGSVGGLLIGALACLMQIKFHFLKLENAAIDYWPVLLKSKDILMLLVILFSTGFVSAYLPGKLLIRKLLHS
jgi:ABC-type lipoprotein release transport system permease subunit